MKAAAVNAVLEGMLKHDDPHQKQHRSSEPPSFDTLDYPAVGQKEQRKSMAPPIPTDGVDGDDAMKRIYFGGFNEEVLPPEPLEPPPIPPELIFVNHAQDFRGHWNDSVGLDTGANNENVPPPVPANRTKSLGMEQHAKKTVARNYVDEPGVTTTLVDSSPPPEPPPDYEYELRKKPESKQMQNVATLDVADLAAAQPDVVLRRVSAPTSGADGRGQKVWISFILILNDSFCFQQASAEPVANGGALERKNHARRTVTKKTRVYVVDGVQVTSTTYHVMADDAQRYKAKEDFNLRYVYLWYRMTSFLSLVYYYLVLYLMTYHFYH